MLSKGKPPGNPPGGFQVKIRKPPGSRKSKTFIDILWMLCIGIWCSWYAFSECCGVLHRYLMVVNLPRYFFVLQPAWEVLVLRRRFLKL